MSLQTAADVPLLITSANSSSERRISPAWTIAHFKSRLEPITGIPASSQKLALKLGGSQQQPLPIHAADEESTQLGAWPLQAYAEISVTSTDPSSALPNYTDVSGVHKFELTPEEYAQRDDTVLSYKRLHGIGRFDPTAPAQIATAISTANAAIAARNLVPGARVRLLAPTVSDPPDDRLGHVRYVGPVPELPGVDGVPWIGVALDEPTGRNDGCVRGVRYFDAGGPGRGVFVRGERCEVGEWRDEEVEGLMDDEEDGDMEEI